MTSTSMRRLVIALEILCSLLALVILAFGIYILCLYNYGFDRLVACVFTMIGAATLITFLMNGCGFIKGGVVCIWSFVTFFLLVIIVQIVGAVFLLKSVGPASSAIANTIDAAWEEELRVPGAMSLYEDWLQCCGRVSAQDYIVVDRDLPLSCFKNQNKSNPDNMLVKGCRLEFENYWYGWMIIFEILVWVLIGLELINGLILCCLCNTLRNERRRQFI